MGLMDLFVKVRSMFERVYPILAVLAAAIRKIVDDLDAQNLPGAEKAARAKAAVKELVSTTQARASRLTKAMKRTPPSVVLSQVIESHVGEVREAQAPTPETPKV